MPAGVNESTWHRAKKAAERQGQAKNWRYIMGIYKNMTKNAAKKFRPRAGDILLSAPRKMSVGDALLRKAWVEAPQGFVKKSHSAIYVGNNTVVEGQIGRGIQSLSWDKWSYANEYDVYRVGGGNARKASKMAKRLVGKGYDVLMALRGWLFPRKYKKIKLKDLNSMFCSTVIAAAYPELPESINKHPLDMMPVDILKSGLVKKVGQG